VIGLVVFDCDGTLVDSQHHIVASMTAAFAARGRPAPDPAGVIALVGLPPEVMAAALLPDLSADEHLALADAYRQAFFRLRQRPDHREPLYPGTIETLDQLDRLGLLLGVATGKSRRGLNATLGAHGLLERFVTIQTADVARGKPDPDMLERAIAETGAAPATTLMVGDTTFDMQMARRARVRPIGVGWGYHSRAALEAAGADQVLEDFAGLVPLAAQLVGGVPCA